MTKTRWIWTGLLVMLLLPGLALGQAKVGTTGVNFLKIGVSARGVALADALLPVADDASTLYYNPAGLINLKNREAIFTHVVLPAGINFDYIGYVMPLPALGGSFGVSATTLYTDAMDETTPERVYGTGRTFTATDFSAGATYAQRLTDKFSVGGTVKYLQENLADEVARGWAADVGTFYDTGWRSVRIAMVISNFGPDMEFISSPFPLPLIFKFGMSAELYQTDRHRITMTAEGTHPNDNVEELHFGWEYAWNETAFLRLGKKMNGLTRDSWDDYQSDKQSYDPFVEYPLFNEDGMLSFDGVSLGGGLHLRNIGLMVDYSYAQLGYLGGVHRFSLGYKFNR